MVTGKPRSVDEGAFVLLLAFGLSACTGADLVHIQDRPDAGARPPLPFDAGSSKRLDIIEEDSIREEFDSFWFVDRELGSGAVLDTNRGVVTLESEEFPKLEPQTSVTMLEPSQNYGVVEAGSIVVDEGVLIDARDSVEFRASETIRITGRLRAGAGGVTLIAGNGVFISGILESQGPVRIRVLEEAGVVGVEGKILTLPSPGATSAEISIITRGSIQVSNGEVRTGDSDEKQSGNITLRGYGNIEIAGFEAEISSGASGPDLAGDVLLSTEADIFVEDEAWILSGMRRPNAGAQQQDQLGHGGGNIDLRAVGSIEVREGASVWAGSSPDGTSEGGAISVLASDTIAIRGAEIIAGNGHTGGGINFASATSTIGGDSLILAGYGERRAGGVIEIRAAGSDIRVEATATLRAGNSICGNGGDLRIIVAGGIDFEEEVTLRAGNVGLAALHPCSTTYRGGNIEILAQDGDEERIRAIADPGTGSPNGEINVGFNPNFTLPVPDVRVRPVGWIVSKIFDRGPEAIGMLPLLIEKRCATPPGTFAKIQLAGTSSTDEPFETWVDLVEDNRDL